ncbi:MAG: Cytochrome b561 [Gammaproteobacteria bacterium]|nr:Cytochrome b561 [Gammaproteobacteria bacterium]
MQTRTDLGVPGGGDAAVLTRYTAPAMLLHWLTAALVLFLFGLGWYMVDLPKGPARSADFALHKSVGILVFLLTIARLNWCLRHPAPSLPSLMPAWQQRLVHIVHRGFYVMLFVHPFFGYLSAEFAGYGTRFFGLPLYNWGWKDQRINEFFTECHEVTGVVLLILIICHLAGAISHMLKKGDRTLARMLPW